MSYVANLIQPHLKIILLILHIILQHVILKESLVINKNEKIRNLLKNCI